MESFKHIQWTPLMVLKASGIVLLGIIALLFLQSLYQTFSLSSGIQGGVQTIGYGAPSTKSMGMPMMYDGDYGYAEDAVETSLSYRNVASESMPVPIPDGGFSTGSDAEAYEVTSYSATIEARDIDRVCSDIMNLKGREEVIFENVYEYERGCSYTFKVLHDAVGSVLDTLNALNPRELSENTYTIKRQIDDYTSEIDILRNKLATIEKTLEEALVAYEDVTGLAARTQNVESLAKIIDSKLQVVERLTNERINVISHIERIERSKANELDRLTYTYFTVSVYESAYFDGEALADSWKHAVRKMVTDVNMILQSLTVGLGAFVFFILQVLTYLFIGVLVLKYTWRGVKAVWRA